MELETNSEQPVSDAERMAAQARQLTITPLHDDVKPEDEPDSVRLAQHLSGPAAPNVSNDIEDTGNTVS